MSAEFRRIKDARHSPECPERYGESPCSCGYFIRGNTIAEADLATMIRAMSPTERDAARKVVETVLRMLVMVIALAIAGCAAAVGRPTDAGDAAPAVDAGAPAACVNSSTCPTYLACLQGLCQTPCQAYEAGCD